MDSHQILSSLSFGKVDAETDDKLSNCFIGTDLLKQALQPHHTLLLGGKGSGKSAIFRLLSQDTFRFANLLQNRFEEIYGIPAYGINSDEYLTYAEIHEINPNSIDDFKYLWQLYFGLKAATILANCPRMRSRISKSNSESLKEYYKSLLNILEDVGLYRSGEYLSKIQKKVKELLTFSTPATVTSIADKGKILSTSYSGKSALNIISLIDLVDKILKETNCLAWILIDQIDLLYLDNLDRRQRAITALVQLLIEYSSRFANINLKVFLRTDIYKQLQIVNKSHLVSLTVELKWTKNLLIKMLVVRAVHDRAVRMYCEEVLQENLDVNRVISATDELILRIFYTIFELNMGSKFRNVSPAHSWITKHIVDGLGMLYPREMIHLGNQAVQKQRELNKNTKMKNPNIYSGNGKNFLVSSRAIKQAFSDVSSYRCDTYLYAEFPHLSKHFDRIRGQDRDKFNRDELVDMFKGLNPNGVDSIRMIFETGLFKTKDHKNADACRTFTIPYLYKSGLGIVARRKFHDRLITRETLLT
ncbi:MAG: hypothetical protein KJ666_18725 [Bacteroidetes bacterium]|nr:hypothetical protein [Bacteroidota bacterium]MBU1421609.1 hypothetical protein [Bacteroidota bacterium]MBU2447590.1 hypothetical protein [Bacteroidota bacterium]